MNKDVMAKDVRAQTALAAWSQIEPIRNGFATQVLKDKVDSLVFRFQGLRADGTGVIAKRGVLHRLLRQHDIQTRVLESCCRGGSSEFVKWPLS
jgi:hypothetical protein